MAKYMIFIGTYSKSLFYGEFDEGSGKISITGTLDVENPAYFHYSGDILYGVSETGKYKGENGGALFSVDVSDPKKMRLIDIKCTHGSLPCHLYAKDGFVFAANYSEGSLSVFETDASGALKPSWQSIHHFGVGPNPKRQEAPHIHFAAMTPDGKYLAVCDLGLDKVFLYPYSPQSGLSSKAKIICCPPGSGPRHLAFSKCGKYMYVLTEMGSAVLSYRYTGEDAEFISETSALPPGFAGESTAAAIHVSPDGSLLGASNRGADCIAVFETKEDGGIKNPTYIKDQKEPRDFGFSPKGGWLLSANQNGDCVKVFKIGNENKSFDQKFAIDIPAPVCIVFGGAI